MTSDTRHGTRKDMNYASYKNLLVWKFADELVNLIYDLTINFPKEELYCLTSQLRRVALSVPANIIEGYARNNKNEFRRFLSIALGSLSEVEYYLDFSYRRKYLTQSQYDTVETL